MTATTAEKEYYGKIAGHYGYSWAALEEAKTLIRAEHLADQQGITSEIGVYQDGRGITVVSKKNKAGSWEANYQGNLS